MGKGCTGPEEWDKRQAAGTSGGGSGEGAGGLGGEARSGTLTISWVSQQPAPKSGQAGGPSPGQADLSLQGSKPDAAYACQMCTTLQRLQESTTSSSQMQQHSLSSCSGPPGPNVTLAVFSLSNQEAIILITIFLYCSL